VFVEPRLTGPSLHPTRAPPTSRHPAAADPAYRSGRATPCNSEAPPDHATGARDLSVDHHELAGPDRGGCAGARAGRRWTTRFHGGDRRPRRFGHGDLPEARPTPPLTRDGQGEIDFVERTTGARPATRRPLACGSSVHRARRSLVKVRVTWSRARMFSPRARGWGGWPSARAWPCSAHASRRPTSARSASVCSKVWRCGLKLRLFFRRNTVVVDMPYHLDEA
jgi:hypothetical protein